jgi:competence protein ComEC
MRLPRPQRVALALPASIAGGWGGAAPRAVFAEAIARETSLGRPALFVVPALALGVIAHLVLPVDPPLLLLAPAVLVAIVAAFAWRAHPSIGFAALLIAAAALGAAASEVSARRASAPKIERSLTTERLVGRVLRVDPRAERAPRVLLAVESIEGLAAAATPLRLIVVGRGLAEVRVGAGIAMAARLAPPPLPTHPGAYNPAFVAFFDRIGGYAFTSAVPEVVTLPPPDRWTAMAVAVMAWRTEITQHIVARLGPEVGSIAAALVTGQRTAITEDMMTAFNASGLMHVLSISGLHMALVAGGTFWLIRALLAAIPAFALRLPVKKIAAGGALATATFYLIASGAEVATTRAYVMIAVMFFAILVDRPAISMRNLLLAAAIILVMMPESVVSASFQMSFFATAGLIAVAERGLLPRFTDPAQPLAMRATAFVAQAVVVTVIVSLVCELAILPIQLHHFHRIAWFGIVGNVLALAVVDILVMPAAFAALVLVPLGLGDLVVPLLGFAVERMIDIARFVGSFPGAVSPVPGFGLAALATCLAGVTWACLLRTRLALLGLVPYLAGFALWTLERPPDIRISTSGDLIALRAPDGRLDVDWTRRDDFVARRWLEADGDGRRPEAALDRGRQCDLSGCVTRLPGGLVVALPRRAAALEEDCARADILITRARAPPDCPRPRLVIDRATIDRAHGIAVTFAAGAPRLSTLSGQCGRRGWCPDPREPRSRRPFARSRAPSTAGTGR